MIAELQNLADRLGTGETWTGDAALVRRAAELLQAYTAQANARIEEERRRTEEIVRGMKGFSLTPRSGG